MVSYHGYLPGLINFLSSRKEPRILEVGVDRGVSLIPLVTTLGTLTDNYVYLGIDVKVQESLKLTLQYMPQPIPRSTFLFEENSLSVLPRLVEQDMKFDVILLDGDHNYHTVSQELKYMDALLKHDGMMVIDDYDGKWSERDLWYAERPDYEGNKIVTARVETEKHGVKPAVDEWLSIVSWNKLKPVEGEAIIVSRLMIGTQ